MCFEKLKVPQEYELILLDIWSLPGNSLGWEPSYKELRAQCNDGWFFLLLLSRLRSQ